MPTILTITDLRGPAGKLESILNSGAPDAKLAVMLCHPHPPSGGTMHHKVVYRAAKAFGELGLPVLRFNFRGAGLSEGSYTRGPGEVEDANAAMDWLQSHLGLPILAAGFSFGAAVAMEAAYRRAEVRGLIALGLPVLVPATETRAKRRYEYGYLAQAAQPKLFLSGDRDAYAPPAELKAIAAAAADPKDLAFIPDADHFFSRAEGHRADGPAAMQQALKVWVNRQYFQ